MRRARPRSAASRCALCGAWRPKGTLAVLHEKGLVAAVRHYFGDNTKAMWLAAGMAVILLIRYLGVILCVVCRFRLRLPAPSGP